MKSIINLAKGVDRLNKRLVYFIIGERNMASFCYECTAELFGEEKAENNDLAGIVRRDEKYYTLCEGCGWITVDKHGKKVEEEES